MFSSEKGNDRMKLRLNRRELGVFALSSTLSVSSFAQSRGDGAWPARPITLVVPYPPGGTTDVVGRQNFKNCFHICLHIAIDRL